MNASAATQIAFPKEGYYLYMDGKNLGPMTQDQILDQYEKGQLPRSTPLWFQGLANWITVADIPELDRRKMAPVEMVVPDKDRPDAVIVQLKGHALPLRPQSIKALITNEEFRRTDMVYDDESKTWVRSDQHSIVKTFYAMPTPPAPAVTAAATAPAAATTAASATTAAAKPVAKVDAKGKDAKTPEKGRSRLLLWFLFAVILGAGAYYALLFLGKI